ncbi:hypothetical protein J8273_7214 [Carpediemonas membranifera]|uniref:Uncharacterized protein n=1 Tax=Carpediemonas membranifera TaxID=201153 RepID=A0A8J6DZV4_9EUKA|nr:hypothetical protein J8273_7214 [Carpediemonas membranifera]|eukprot:KAG9390941.1 hypothetical protein J8273_7214 [Carpediemonas membranifera]
MELDIAYQLVALKEMKSIESLKINSITIQKEKVRKAVILAFAQSPAGKKWVTSTLRLCADRYSASIQYNVQSMLFGMNSNATFNEEAAIATLRVHERLVTPLHQSVFANMVRAKHTTPTLDDFLDTACVFPTFTELDRLAAWVGERNPSVWVIMTEARITGVLDGEIYEPLLRAVADDVDRFTFGSPEKFLQLTDTSLDYAVESVQIKDYANRRCLVKWIGYPVPVTVPLTDTLRELEAGETSGFVGVRREITFSGRGRTTGEIQNNIFRRREPEPDVSEE